MQGIERKVIVIAGPNGAGKTTFAREFLPNEAACPVFVNADLIAAGLAPFAPETATVQAGRLMPPCRRYSMGLHLARNGYGAGRATDAAGTGTTFPGEYKFCL